MNPTVSVCVPTFNSAKYLRECLDSILSQTFTDFELLIVDNYSSDETPSIAKEYADRDRRIRVIVNEQNIGAVPNFNRCVGLAQGSWIKFVFSDDFIAPRCLELMLAASKPESALICCRRNILLEDGRIESRRLLDEIFPGLTEISANDYCNAFLDELRLGFTGKFENNWIGEPTNVMMRRSVFYRLGIFNPYLDGYCDLEFWTRVAAHVGIIYVPETLATFRVHKQALHRISRSEAHRKYRHSVLDPLIILHDFAFNPVYAPLREAAANGNPSVNLTELFAKRAYACWGETIGKSLLLKEWEKVASIYPNCSYFVKCNHTKFAPEYFFSRLKRKVKSLGSLGDRKLPVFFEIG